MNRKSSERISPESMTLLVSAMEHLTQSLRQLYETMDQAVFDIQESKVAACKDEASEILEKIRSQSGK